MTIQQFPLAILQIAPENPRQNVSEAHIDRLAANIAEQGLKQNLVGYEEDGVVQITAGGCRLRALRKLAEESDQGQIPVRIEDRAMAVATALSENVVRADMGHAERVRAYKKLHEEGFSSDQIITMYGLTRKGYSNTMRIADLPDVILDALSAGEMSYDHAAAFALGEAAEATGLYETLKDKGFGSWPKHEPHVIVRNLTNEKVDPKNRLAKFADRAKYEAAGGTVTEDLFSENVFFDDGELLKKVALNRLTLEASKLEKEWAWAEAEVERVAWDSLKAYGRVYPGQHTISEAEEDEYNALAELIENDACDDAGKARFEALEDLLEIEIWTDEQKKVAGVIVHVGHNGDLVIERGLIKPEDVKQAVADGVMQPDRHQPEAGTPDKDPLDYSQSLREDLCITIKRTAMQCEMLEKPAKLLDILATNLCGGLPQQRLAFSNFQSTRATEALIEQGLAPDKRLIEAWDGKTKGSRDKKITAQLASRLEWNSKYEPKIRNWWTPNAAFFKRLTKAQLIEVACDIHAGSLHTWDKFKKGEIVATLEDIFIRDASGSYPASADMKAITKAAKTWLPPCLRPVEVEDEAEQKEAA